jgi:hypothetical protein
MVTSIRLTDKYTPAAVSGRHILEIVEARISVPHSVGSATLPDNMKMDMSVPQELPPEGMHTSEDSYPQSPSQSQSLRRRNIIVPPLYFGMVAPKIYRR